MMGSQDGLKLVLTLFFFSIHFLALRDLWTFALPILTTLKRITAFCNQINNVAGQKFQYKKSLNSCHLKLYKCFFFAIHQVCDLRLLFVTWVFLLLAIDCWRWTSLRAQAVLRVAMAPPRNTV